MVFLNIDKQRRSLLSLPTSTSNLSPPFTLSENGISLHSGSDPPHLLPLGYLNLTSLHEVFISWRKLSVPVSPTECHLLCWVCTCCKSLCLDNGFFPGSPGAPLLELAAMSPPVLLVQNSVTMGNNIVPRIHQKKLPVLSFSHKQNMRALKGHSS